MIKENIQAANFGKKPYATPQMKAYQVKPASIICTSGNASTESLTEETYDWGSSSVKEQRNYSNSVTW